MNSVARPIHATRARAALGIFLLFFLLLIPIQGFASGSRQNLPLPGFRSFGIWDPGSSFRMNFGVWYPTRRATRDSHIEGWTIRAGKDGAVAPGKYPVILLSHDAAASRFASHDLAAHLARHGFIVIAPTHPGDNADDTSLFYRAHNFAARPAHMIAAFTEARQSHSIGPFMDTDRIGLLGVGSGAATVLQLAGAGPDLSRLDDYCPAVPSLDPLCSPWAMTFHPRMEREFALLSANPSIFMPYIERPTPPMQAAPAPSAPSGPEEQGQTGEKQLPPDEKASSPVGPEADTTEQLAEQAGSPRERQPVLAVGLLTPGQINLFPEDVLRGFSTPVGILAGVEDNVYPPQLNAARLLELLPQHPAFRILQDTNHFDLQPPCPPVYQDGFPAMCGQAGPDAVDIRKVRNDFFTRFFQGFLGSPIPAEPAPARGQG